MPFRLFRSPVPTSPQRPIPPAVKAIIDRCKRLTWEEIKRLGEAWDTRHYVAGRAVTRPIGAAAHRAIEEARRPDWQQWAHDADWALRWAVGAPGDAAIYFDHSYPEGPALAAVRDAALATAAGELLNEAQRTELLAPWRAVVDVCMPD